jgi:hypothetical protein
VYQQNDWIDYLSLAAFAYNNYLNEILQIIPYQTLIGYHPHISIDVGDNAFKGEASAAKQRIQQLIEMRKQLELRLKEA